MILDTQEAIGLAHRVPGLVGMVELNALAEVLDGCHDVCDVGAYQGRVTTLMTLLCTGTVYAVDWFNSEPYADIPHIPADYPKRFQEHLAEEIGSGKVVVLSGQSHEMALQLADKQFDCVWIDADHDYEHVKLDIEAYLPLVKPGGIICGHDYEAAHDPSIVFPGLQKAVHEAFGVDGITVKGGCWFVKTKG